MHGQAGSRHRQAQSMHQHAYICTYMHTGRRTQTRSVLSTEPDTRTFSLYLFQSTESTCKEGAKRDTRHDIMRVHTQSPWQVSDEESITLTICVDRLFSSNAPFTHTHTHLGTPSHIPATYLVRVSGNGAHRSRGVGIPDFDRAIAGCRGEHAGPSGAVAGNTIRAAREVKQEHDAKRSVCEYIS